MRSSEDDKQRIAPGLTLPTRPDGVVVIAFIDLIYQPSVELLELFFRRGRWTRNELGLGF